MSFYSILSSLFRRKPAVIVHGEPEDNPPAPRYAPPAGGEWRSWITYFPSPDDSYDNIPYRHDLVEIWRKEWPAAHVVRPRSAEDMPPWMNGYGLYWRPWRDDTIEGR